MRRAFVIAVIWLSGCGTAKLTGTDCPQPDQLLSGVTISCGGHAVVGTVVASDLPLCDAQTTKNCIATAEFRAADLARLDETIVKNGQTVLGTRGSLKTTVIGGTFPLCSDEGQSACIVADELVAVDTQNLAEKIADGVNVAGVVGSGDLTPAVACSGNAQVGCLSDATYPAFNQAFVGKCLVSEQ